MLYFLISITASIVGAICGIGGGVIIKPCMDMLSLTDAATASFLSGCTVLSMTAYSVGRNVFFGRSTVNLAQTTPLAFGAGIGGIAGKQLFVLLTQAFASGQVKRLQALCLLIVTFASFVYTLNKHRITGVQVKNSLAGGAIGLGLGVMSSFLGIGGGPINLVVLYFFFGMDTKTAAQNSLYIILFSQIASLLLTVVSVSVPLVEMRSLVLMMLGGVLGGIIGRSVNAKITAKTVDRLFRGVMVLLMGLCVYNMLS